MSPDDESAVLEDVVEVPVDQWGFVEMPSQLVPPTQKQRPVGIEDDKRRHLTLVEREYLLMIADIDKSVADAYATEYAEADEFQDPVMRSWLDYQLMLSVSKSGRGRDDLVRAMRGEDDERENLDAGINPGRRID